MSRILRGIASLALAAASAAAPLPAAAQSDQQSLVNASVTALSNFLRDPEMTWLQQNFHRAKGVLIAPEVVKAGFIFGGSGGRAVLVARDHTGRWRGPVFYVLATASVGFQAGVSVSENLTLVLADKALNALLATSVKFGPDISIAAGPIGAGAKADIVTDLVTYSRAKGVYGGINLDGTVVTASDDWNRAYYKKNVLPADVLVRGDATNPQGAALVNAVAKAAASGPGK